ncbi:MAG: hypothetical protein NTU66_04045 [Elusimicrobia bacterium]|nr:hypothetical protein [Elusimicrobiota bacterium]
MKYLRIVVALVLIPVVGAVMYELFYLVAGMAANITESTLPFWLGLGIYFLFQLIFAKPLRVYVFGHELTHALAGILSGAKIKKFNVAATGGSVVLTKTNIWIALSPYFVPVYTVILLCVYGVAGWWWPVSEYHSWFLFAMGFSLSFHFALTHYALMQGQKDLESFGVFFSAVIVLLVNGLVIAVLLKVLFPRDVVLSSYFAAAAGRTVLLYQWMGEKSWVVFQKMR